MTSFLKPLAAAALLCASAAQAQDTFKIAYIDPLSGPFANVGELMLTHTQYAIEDINAKGGVLKGVKLQLLQFDSKLSAQETFKVAYIDPLSGPFANVGELMLTHTQYAIEDINAKGGVLKGTKLQLLQFDSKLSAQESQSALQAAIDQGAKAIVTGGSGSSVVTALVQAAARHNQRNPGKEILVLNHSSIDPELTGKACNFWHFQFEANTAMKMKAIANYIKKQPDIKKVYLLNQDYAHGKQWAHYGREMVGLARPDIQFVGEALHPIGRVKDLAPYLAKGNAE